MTAEAHLRREEHQFDCEAARTDDGTVHDLLAEDRDSVRERLDRTEES